MSNHFTEIEDTPDGMWTFVSQLYEHDETFEVSRLNKREKREVRERVAERENIPIGMLSVEQHGGGRGRSRTLVVCDTAKLYEQTQGG